MLLRSYPSVSLSVGRLAVRPSLFRLAASSFGTRCYSSTLSSYYSIHQLIGRRFATSAQSVASSPPLQSLSVGASLSSSCVAQYGGKPLICYGCGAAFQSDFENRAGYIDRSVLQRYLTALDDARSMGSLSPLKAASDGLEKMDLYMADRLKAMEEEEDHQTRERRLTRGQRQEQEYLREDPGREVMRIKEVSMNETTETKESAKYILMDQSPQVPTKKDDQTVNGVTIIDSTVEDKKASKADAAKTESLIAAFNRGEIDEFTLMGKLSENGKKRAFLTKQDIKDIKKMEKFQRHFRVNPSSAELANTVDDPHKKDTMLTLSKQLHCARCHSLVHNGYAHGHLDSIRAEDFRLFLKERFTNPRSPRSVLIWLIDIADFEGSIIHDMHTLVGAHNPIILAINKMDLMPNSMNESKLRHWLKTECQRRGIDYAAMILLSAKYGQGMNQLVKEALHLAKSNRRAGLRDIYVVGTTNVGKSTLINQLINKGFIRGGSLTDPVTIHPEKNVAIADPSASATDANHENKSSDSEAIHLPVNSTASPMPGTTLGMVKFHILPRTSGLHLYDTPGIIQRSHFSQHLTIDELKVAMPRTTRITPRSYRINAGQSVLIGGLVRIDQMAGAPFYYTFFLHNEVTVHITSIEKLEGEEDRAVLYDQRFIDGDKKRKLQKLADNAPSLSDEQRKANYRAFFHKNIGKIVSPPFTSDRFDALALVDGVRIRFTTEGKGWDAASDDIVLPGLGWISLTGCGPLSVRVQCAAGVMAHRREPIMPNEARRSTKKWTGVHRILG